MSFLSTVPFVLLLARTTIYLSLLFVVVVVVGTTGTTTPGWWRYSNQHPTNVIKRTSKLAFSCFPLDDQNDDVVYDFRYWIVD